MPDQKTNADLRTGEASESGTPPYADELRPHDRAGENAGSPGAGSGVLTRTAYDVKGAHHAFHTFSDDDLKQIPILPPGARLEQGATYIDLKAARPSEFSALGGMTAGEDTWYVPKSNVPYTLWNRLIGVDNPERLD